MGKNEDSTKQLKVSSSNMIGPYSFHLKRYEKDYHLVVSIYKHANRWHPKTIKSRRRKDDKGMEETKKLEVKARKN